MTHETITPPFSNYHRAKLERLVREGFERIELRAVEKQETYWGIEDPLTYTQIRAGEFQILCAAEYYLRTTK